MKRQEQKQAQRQEAADDEDTGVGIIFHWSLRVII